MPVIRLERVLIADDDLGNLIGDTVVDVTVWAMPYTMQIGGGHDDVKTSHNEGFTPVLRSGIAREGTFEVEVADQTAYSQTLATLQTLYSPVGHGDYNIYEATAFDANGNVTTWQQIAWRALVTIDVIGDWAQIVQINYRGTIETEYEDIPGYGVTYSGNGNDGGTVPSAQTKSAGIDLTLDNNSGSMTKTGYSFDGWNTSADGTGTPYAGGATYSADARVTLHAQWV